MSMCQPSLASAPANAVDPNHPCDGEGVPTEVEVPNETASVNPPNRHGDASGSHGLDPGLTTIGGDPDLISISHQTPFVGDQNVRTCWGLATQPNWLHPPPVLQAPAPPGVDGASFLRGNIPNRAFRGFQAAAGIFHNTGGFGVSTCRNVFT
jgi:hypothetical protein